MPNGLRQAEVHQLCPGLGQHDVARLQVSMNDSGPMRALQRLGNFGPNFSTSLSGKAPSQPLGQRLPFQELHDEIIGSVLRANVVELADMGMIQGGDGACFTVETLLSSGAEKDAREGF